MTELALASIISVTLLAGVAILAFATLAAWRGWLDLRRAELARGQAPMRAAEDEQPAVLIELASVKERLRRLEAIASGVEL